MARSTPNFISNDQPNWLIIAKQMWKLYVALLGFTVTFLCFALAGVAFMMEGQIRGGVVLGGMTVGVVTFLWLLRTLRCPSCEKPLVGTMIRKHSHMSWLIDLVHLTECPLCQADLLKAPSRSRRMVRHSS